MIKSLQALLTLFSCRLACTLLLLVLCLQAQSQTSFWSRDNYTGLTASAPSWDGNAPPDINTGVSDAQLYIRGYMGHGTTRSFTNLTISGTGAALIVEDTLRVHGMLDMKAGTKVHVKPSGILIVLNDYQQESGVIFVNEGTAIFLQNWVATGTPDFSSSGKVYIKGTKPAEVTADSYNQLHNDNHDLYDFSRTHVVIAESCAGNNNGSVILDSPHGTVLRWESSMDYFSSPPASIANTSGTLNYTNLSKTISYRAAFSGGTYSDGFTIILPVPAKGGTLSGTTEVCEGTNTVSLALGNYLGEIVQWESSPDNFKTISSTTLSSSPTFSFSDLSRKMYYRVLVKNGTCSQAYSAIYSVDYFANSQGGTLSGSATVCKGSNSGTIDLSGHTGSVVRWESSANVDFSPLNASGFAGTQITYSNLSTTTYYRAVVKNGPCSEALSASAKITVSEVAGGAITGPQPFCTGGNSTTLTLSGHIGSIIRWESSTDPFHAYQEIAHTGADLLVPAPVHTTRYRALVGDGGSCSNAYSAEFELTGNPALNGGALAVSKGQAPAEGLAQAFSFSGDAKNETGNGNDGIITGAVPFYDRFGMVNTAYSFDGVDDIIATTTQYPSPGPQVFAISIWFKTTETTGGRLIGFGHSQADWSSDYDRHIYMDDQGQLYFGVYTDGNASGAYAFVQTPLSYNDGQWHQAVGVLSAAGMELYVDGELRIKDETITVAQEFSGFWRLGGDSMGGWPEAPTHPMFEGQLDDVYIYSRALGQAEISKLYGEGTAPLCAGETLNLQAATVPGATYTWTGPNSFSSGLQNPLISNITSAHAGTYLVKIEVNGCVIEGNTLVAITPVTVPGKVVSDQTNVCTGSNFGTLTLADYTGQIIRWENSADDFMNDIQLIAHTQDLLTFTNITATTSYRAIVKSGDCGEEMASAAAKVITDVQTVGGSISGSTVVCKSGNSGILELSGHTGNVIQWESALIEDFSTFTVITSVSESHTYENLVATTWYRAKVKNGTCGEVYSASALVEVSEVAGGSLAGNTTVCQGSNSGTVTLSGYTGDIVRWESSADNFATVSVISNTSAELSYLNLNETTSYRAVTGNGGVCAEVPSSIATITVDPKTAAGMIVASQTTVCSGVNSGALTLENYAGEVLRWESSVDNFATITPITNTTVSYNYENLTTTIAYRAVVASGTCGEAASPAVTIEVVPVSQGGSLSGSTEVCKGSNNGVLMLSGYTGNIVRWESSADAEFTTVNIIQSAESQISFLNLNATTWYRAVTENSPCAIAHSTVAVVTVSQVAGGFLAGSQEVCSGSNSGELNLSGFSGNILRWERSTDLFANDIQPLNHTGTTLSFLDLTESASYRVLIGNEVCDPVFSEVAQITVQASTVGGKLIADKNTVCAGENSFTLFLQGFTGDILRWERSLDGFTSHQEVIGHALPELPVADISETSSYRAVVKSGNCSEAFSDFVTIVAEEPARGGLVAGGKRLKPGGNAGTLELQSYEGTILYWESSSDNFVKDVKKIEHSGTFLPYENINTSAWYRAVVNKNTCGKVYSEVAVLSVNRPPVAVNDVFETVEGEVFSGMESLLDNDSDPDQDPIMVKPVLGLLTSGGNEVDIEDSGKIIFSAQDGFTGTDSISYELCDIAGEASLCSYGMVIFHVKEKSVSIKDILVYKGLSPNQDNKNDKWFIKNIEYFPDNHVQIFNAGGILVFEMQGYDNAEKAFAGIGNRGSGSSGKELPEATYYYRIYFSESQTDLKGYVILNR